MDLTDEVSIFAEGSVVETAQCIFLGVSLLVCLIQLLREKRRMTRPMLVLYVLIFASVLLREVDVQELSLPRVLIVLGSGIGRNAWLGLSWLAYVWYAFSRQKLWVPQMRHFLLRTSAGWTLILGCLCYVSGWPFDKELFHLGEGINLAIEESLELSGTMFFFLSALLLVRFGAPLPGGGGAWRMH